MVAGGKSGKGTLRERGVPASVEGERFVLGALLIDDAAFDEVAARISEADFFAAGHRRIFQAMLRLHGRGERIEYLGLVDELGKLGSLEKAGGGAYVARLTDGMPRAGFLEGYVGIVREKARLRGLIAAGDALMRGAARADRPADEILAEAEASLAAMRGGREGPGPVTVREVLDAFPGGADGFMDPSAAAGGIRGPFHDLEAMTNGLQPGQLAVLAGRPAMGKTAMALNIAAHAAAAPPKGEGRRVALFSLEMSREALLRRVACSEARVDHAEFLGGRAGPHQLRRVRRAIDAAAGSGLLIDDSGDLGMAELSARCRRLRSAGGLDLVVVDYLQLLAPAPGARTRVQEVSGISRGLKLLARELRVPVLALSQLSRAPEGKDRRDARPRLSDLRDSGSIEQDADLVCFIYRAAAYRPHDENARGRAELIVAKQRNGPTGTVHLAFMDKWAAFGSLERAPRDSEPLPPPEAPPPWAGPVGAVRPPEA